MKATELRIGNYVRAKSHEMSTFEEPVKVCITYLEMFCHNPQRVNFEPIPLTEKWLADFGFERHHEDYYNDVIFIKNVIGNIEFEWGIYPQNLGSGCRVMNFKPLQYVHQLQNLYFALTGEELTFKPATP